MSARLSETIASLYETDEMRNVDLSDADIDDEGASALADALKVNTSATSVELDYNQLGAEGASALAGALKVNMTLTSIDITSNQIGAEG
jgi:hypothetical protein